MPCATHESAGTSTHFSCPWTRGLYQNTSPERLGHAPGVYIHPTSRSGSTRKVLFGHASNGLGDPMKKARGALEGGQLPFLSSYDCNVWRGSCATAACPSRVAGSDLRSHSQVLWLQLRSETWPGSCTARAGTHGWDPTATHKEKGWGKKQHKRRAS